jgi:membrane protein
MREQIKHYIWSYNACDVEAPRSAWRQFLQIVYMVGRDLIGGMITLYAMSLVYTTLLSLVPLLAVSISVLKGFGVHDQLEPTLARLLAPLG